MRLSIAFSSFALLATLTIGSHALSQNSVDPIPPAPTSIRDWKKPAGFSEANRASLSSETSPAQQRQLRELPGLSSADAPVDVVSISPDKLLTPLIAGPNGQVLSANPSRPAPGPLTLNIDGQHFELAYISEIADPKINARHITMQVLDIADSYARFSVTGDNAIVGTLVTPEVTYRFVQGTGGQMVYRVSNRSGVLAKYRRLTATESNVGALEKRHAQLEHLADIQPDLSMSSESGRYLRLKGGRLGKLRGVATPKSLRRVLGNLSDLDYAPTNLDIEITSARKHATGQSIEFQQTINGIPVALVNRLEVDTTGSITEIQTQFVDPERVVSNVPLMSEQESLKTAVKAIEQETKEPAREFDLFNPTTIFYSIEGTQRRLVPKYQFDVRIQNKDIFRVWVNAQTGEVVIIKSPSLARCDRRFCTP